MAIGILVLAALLVWSLVVWPIMDLAVSRQSEVTALTEELGELRAIEQHTPFLTRREQNAVTGLQALNVFWSGSSPAAIAAAMQDLIRSAAQQNGGTVSSSSALPVDTAAHHMLGIRARVDGSLECLQRVLIAIDMARPKLFLDNLAVSAVGPATKELPEQLSFELSVSGYLETAPHAH